MCFVRNRHRPVIPALIILALLIALVATDTSATHS